MQNSDFENPKTGHLWGIEVKMKYVTKERKKAVPTYSDSQDFNYKVLLSPFNLWREYENAGFEDTKQQAKDKYNSFIDDLERLEYKHPFMRVEE